jgi:hypothetical protein
MVIYRFPGDDTWEGTIPSPDLAWVKGRRAAFRKRWPGVEAHIVQRITNVTTAFVEDTP